MTRCRRPSVTEKEKKSRALRAYRDLLDAAEALRGRMSRQLEFWDLTMTQFDVLGSLEREGVQYPTELSRRLGCTLENMMVVVYRLEKMGLVSRRVSALPRVGGKPGKGVRVVLVELTREGKALMAKVAPKYAKVVKSELRALEGREQVSLSRLCQKLLRGDPMRYAREMCRMDPEDPWDSELSGKEYEHGENDEIIYGEE
jgi:DNA-binding MarR family transcriptional regulator